MELYAFEPHRAADEEEAFDLRQPGRPAVEAAVRTLIAATGDDPAREGLRDTPARVARAYGEWFAGYAVDPARLLETTFGEARSEERRVGNECVSKCRSGWDGVP